MTPPPPKTYIPVEDPIPPATSPSNAQIPPTYTITPLSPSTSNQYSIDITIDIHSYVETPSTATPYPPIKLSIKTPTPINTVESPSTPSFTTTIKINQTPVYTVETSHHPQSPSTTHFKTPVYTVETDYHNSISPNALPLTPILQIISPKVHTTKLDKTPFTSQ